MQQKPEANDLPKKYPWQRWVDRDKNNKKKSNYHGQKKEPSWKNFSLQSLKEYFGQKKFRVVKVDSLPDGYIGMNYYAARNMDFPFPYSKDTILVKKGLTDEETQTTIRHETREVYLEEGGLSHDEAHDIAERKD